MKAPVPCAPLLSALFFMLLLLATAAARAGEAAEPAGFPVVLHAEGDAATEVIWLRQLPVRSARLRGVPRVEPLDGLDSPALPLPAPLRVELARSFPVSYVELEGDANLRIYAGGQPLTPAAAGPNTPADSPSGPRLALGAPARRRILEVVPAAPGASLSEARFYQAGLAARPVGTRALAPAEGTAPGLALTTGPLPQGEGARAVLLEMLLRAPFPAGLRVRLVQASEPDRTWFQADLRPLPPAGADSALLALVLDPPDTWCPPGDAILLQATALDAPPPAGAGTDALPPAHASRLTPHASRFTPHVSRLTASLVTRSADEVRDEFVLTRLNWFAAWYAAHAADAPWERPEWNPDAETAARWLRALQEWHPRHPGVIAYAAHVLQARRDVGSPAPGPANAPPWARLAHELLKRNQFVANWWRVGRQQPDGLFGGDVAGDAVLLETLAGVPLITGDPLLRQGVRAAADTAWLAAGRGQVPGAAAPAMGADALAALTTLGRTQPPMLLTHPGDPLAMERCLLAAAPLAAWLAPSVNGHRHLLSRADTDDERALDAAASLPAAGPALAAAWAAGHSELLRLLTEWAASWAEDVGPAGGATTVGAVAFAVGAPDASEAVVSGTVGTFRARYLAGHVKYPSGGRVPDARCRRGAAKRPPGRAESMPSEGR